jgi:hypothetical protein
MSRKAIIGISAIGINSNAAAVPLRHLVPESLPGLVDWFPVRFGRRLWLALRT